MVEPAGLSYERLVGRYALYGEIASGGMATVHFGRLLGPVGFSRTVAIKRLHAQFAKDPEFVAMFLDEARLAGRIQHPNVVATLDVVALEGELFLVMEYVQGESLARLLGGLHRTRTKCPPNVAVAIMTGVLYGLHAAHEATDERGEPLSIVHRDVSPQNVLVGTDGVARVLDFGVAKAAGRMQATREGEIKGKLSYMAPEQMRGEATMDRRTDIYGAAVVLWETLTARRLFDGEHAGVIFSKVMKGNVAKPSSFVPGITSALDEVVLRGLDHDLSRRYATAREMAMDLEDRVGTASPRQVSEWLASVAGESLSKRAVRVKQIESLSTPPPMQLDALAMTGSASARHGQIDGSVPPGSARAYVPSPGSSRETVPIPQSAPAHAPSWGSGFSQSPTSLPSSSSAVEPMPVSGASASQLSGITATAPSTSPGGKGLWVAGGAGALIVAVVIAVFFVARSSPSAGPTGASPVASDAPSATALSVATAPSAVSPALPPSNQASATPVASTDAASSSAPVASTAPVASSVAVASTAPVAAGPSGPAGTVRPSGSPVKPAGTSSPPAKADCVPPFTIDSSGIRRIKPQCL